MWVWNFDLDQSYADSCFTEAPFGNLEDQKWGNDDERPELLQRARCLNFAS